MRIFKGIFTKSPLKQGPLTAVPTYNDEKIKSTATPCFLCALSVGAVCPKPRHKKLFEKSFFELQKLHQNKMVCWMGSSLAHLSPKERCVLLSFFLILHIMITEKLFPIKITERRCLKRRTKRFHLSAEISV